MKQRMDSAILLNLLKQQYPDRCTKTAPFAYWKMKALMVDGDAFHIPEHDCHYLIRDHHLLYYSSPDGLCHIPVHELNELNAVSLPACIFDQVKDSLYGFEANYSWGLRYDRNIVPQRIDSSRYTARDFNFGDEWDYEIAAKIISGDESGTNTWMTDARVRRMTAFSAFDPSLWFFVCDNETQKRVAVSISAYAPEVKETDLDWIFVLPSYQGKGVGRFLIQETIRRCEDKSDMIRVGGTVAFYRRCGFVDDALWVWATKPGYQLTCESIQP